MKNTEEKLLMVTIRCITYNHEPYIRQCLEGFVMQKTDFPFVAIVHDDASTDGTADIIREYAEKYPDIIKPIFETENQYSKKDGSLTRIMDKACEETGAKYIAICEGDDYWIDPLKLQKQVDFLENHSDYGLVHARVKVYDEKSKRFHRNLIGFDFSDVDQIIVSNKVATLSVCFKTELYKSYYRNVTKDSSWKMGDYPLWIYIALKSRVYFLNETVGVYRVLENSASHNVGIAKELNFLHSACSISRFFSINYEKKYLLPQIKKNFLHGILGIYAVKNHKVDKKLYNLIRELKVITVKGILLLILVNSELGRRYLRNKWNK